jgi:hypothetical protein
MMNPFIGRWMILNKFVCSYKIGKLKGQRAGPEEVEEVEVQYSERKNAVH